MNLVKIETKRTRTGNPSISFAKKGVIRFNTDAVKALDLKPGTEISFYFDSDEPSDIYFKPEIGGIKFRALESTEALLSNNVEISLRVLSIPKKNSTNMLVSTEPTKDGFYAIITKSAK